MPLFVYYCKECNKKFEVLSERWNGRCPKCGSKEVTKMLSTFAFSFNPPLR